MSATDQKPALPHAHYTSFLFRRCLRCLTRGFRFTLAVVLLDLSGGALLAAGRVETISAEWSSSGQSPLKIRHAEASTSLSEQYAPERICDGDRRNTKWVSPVRPSATAPQWVTLSLAGGPRAVTSVAVFGERIDNDGIVDADIQLKMGGEFRSVASVRDAKTAAWLAQFEAVTTDQVRLVVLRSGGPTDHTDVFEVEVYGDPPTEAELRVLLPEALKNLQQAAASVREPALGGAPGLTNCPAYLRGAWERATNSLRQLSGRQMEWATAPRAVLTRDLDEAEEAVAALERMKARLAQRAAGASPLSDLLARVRRTGQRLAASSPAGAVVSPSEAVLTNNALTVWLEGDGLRWNAVWHEPVPAALAGVGFSVEVDGSNATAGPAKAISRRFHDWLGDALCLLQTWERGGVRIERELRLYTNSDFLTVGGRVVNGTAGEIRLGTANLLSVGDRGGWELGSTWEALPQCTSKATRYSARDRSRPQGVRTRRRPRATQAAGCWP